MSKKLIELRALRARVDEAIEAEVRRIMARRPRREVIAERIQAQTPRRKQAICGTDGGYYRHRRTLKEPACDDCREAHNEAEALRKARHKTVATVHIPSVDGGMPIPVDVRRIGTSREGCVNTDPGSNPAATRLPEERS